MSQASAEFIPTRIAILTVSSRRGEEYDTSGHWLREAAQEAGHQVVFFSNFPSGVNTSPFFMIIVLPRFPLPICIVLSTSILSV